MNLPLFKQEPAVSCVKAFDFNISVLLIPILTIILMVDFYLIYPTACKIIVHAKCIEQLYRVSIDKKVKLDLVTVDRTLFTG